MKDIEKAVQEHKNIFGESVSKYQIVSANLEEHKTFKKLVEETAAV